MNEVKKLTFRDRIRDAINAFHGRKIGSLRFGVDLKRCSECEYKNNDIREELLVIAGTRAAYMHDANVINIPEGLEGEHKLACDISRIVNKYLNNHDDIDINFDLYIETALTNSYGTKN